MQIGNAVINDETDTIGMYEYFDSHALVSQETTSRIMKYCSFKPNIKKQSEKCHKAVDEADSMINPIDVYNIYAPLCSNSSLTDEPKKKTSSLSTDPCTDNYVYAYMNRPEVQKALHANLTNIPYDWEPCR